MDSIDIVTLINTLHRVAQEAQRIGDALERSNLLQEDSNRINLAAVGLQEQQHQENKASQDAMQKSIDSRSDRIEGKLIEQRHV